MSYFGFLHCSINKNCSSSCDPWVTIRVEGPANDYISISTRTFETFLFWGGVGNSHVYLFVACDQIFSYFPFFFLSVLQLQPRAGEGGFVVISACSRSMYHLPLMTSSFRVLMFFIW